MKKTIIFSLLIISLWSSVHPEIGCIDNSQYTDISCGYDYKKYYLACCNCPCDRYAHSYKRGRCERCLHFRAPKPLITKDNTASGFNEMEFIPTSTKNDANAG